MSASRFKKSYPETRIAQRSWDERFEALVKYKNEHGNCNVPTRFKSDTGLGLFVSKIRNGGIEITDDQRARLSAIGFVWETLAQKREREWTDMFAQFREHRSTMTRAKNPKLHKWVAHQRFLNSKGKLKTDRYQKMDSIGFDWVTCNKDKPLAVRNKFDKQWISMYHKLVDFYSENGHTMVPVHYEDVKSLGTWVRTQRWKYKENELKDDRIALLNDIQFVWKCNHENASTSVQQKDWDVMFELLKDYKEMHGGVNIPSRKLHQERPLGQWLSNQRAEARRGKLDQMRASRLKSLGVEWTYHTGEPRGWGKYYLILEAFQQKHGHCMVTKSGDDEKYKGLINWIKSQILLHERGKLSAIRKAKLDRLGFKWDKDSPGCELVVPSAPRAKEVVSQLASYHLDADSPRMEEVLSSSSPHRLAKAEQQAGISSHAEKASDVIGSLDTDVVKREMKKALKKAPGRAMKTKHLRRHLREVLGLPRTSKKRDLEKLLDRVIDSSFKIVKREKMVSLLKHHTAKAQRQMATVTSTATNSNDQGSTNNERNEVAVESVNVAILVDNDDCNVVNVPLNRDLSYRD